MSVGINRKSFWHLFKTCRSSVTQLDMTNKWLKEQGLISIKDLWVSMHDPATARQYVDKPLAAPHAGCCGGWGRKKPAYPIIISP